MKNEIQTTAQLPVSFLLDIVNKLPNPSTYPKEIIKYSFQTIVNNIKPFASEIDREYDITEIVFEKGESMGEKSWMFETITRTRTTIYLSDYIPVK